MKIWCRDGRSEVWSAKERRRDPERQWLLCVNCLGEQRHLLERAGAREEHHVVAADLVESLQLGVDCGGRREGVGAGEIEEVVAVIVADVVVGGGFRVNAEAEIAPGDDARPPLPPGV